MRAIRVVACYALVIVLTTLMPASAQVRDFITIDVPGASFTLPRGINSEGDIVGFYGVGTATHGFLLHDGTFTDIDVPGASATRPRGINPQGDIVGFYVAAGVTHGFLLRDGSVTTIDFPGASSTQALGINPRGDVVGQYSAGGATHGFLLREGTFTTIDVSGPLRPWPVVSTLGVTSLARHCGGHHSWLPARQGWQLTASMSPAPHPCALRHERSG